MAAGLRRWQEEGHLHLVTVSCFERKPYLGSAAARDLFVWALERMRVRYGFAVVGYAVMPEHVHLLVSEPAEVLLSVALQALKISVAKRLPESPFWTVRYHDFNVYSRDKVVEKVKYLHRNPVARGLCRLPEDWEWSSYRDYFCWDGAVGVDFSYVTGLEDREASKVWLRGLRSS